MTDPKRTPTTHGEVALGHFVEVASNAGYPPRVVDRRPATDGHVELDLVGPDGGTETVTARADEPLVAWPAE